MLRRLALLPIVLLSACKPPATDDYVARVGITERQGPRLPIDSPDTEGAAWAPGRQSGRLLYGHPGQPPLFSLQCESARGLPAVTFTRHAAADPGAQAMLALIGNGHVARLFVDAVPDGNLRVWRGSLPAGSPELEVLTGAGRIEATVPGAGSLILNPSGLPGRLVSACRAPLAGSAAPG